MILGSGMDEEDLVLMAANMIKARKTLRNLLGDKYEAVIEPGRVLIRGCMKDRGCSAVKAATDLSNVMLERGAGGMAVIKVIAACADVMQEEDGPTEEDQGGECPDECAHGGPDNCHGCMD